MKNGSIKIDANHDDFDPCWLPGGRVVFNSTRRGGNLRCGWGDMLYPTYTLHSMESDGSDIICLSYHETHEYHPSVDNNGMIVYTRWDYVDRNNIIAHHLWYCYPDGRDPRSSHGNYPVPLTTISGSDWSDGRRLRPYAEYNIRSIPGSHKYIATAGPHHGQSFGSLVLIDPRIEDNNIMSQVERITPEAPFPESETGTYEYWPYGTAWPLSEDFYLCNYNDGIYTLDKFGNRELIHKAVGYNMRPIDPIPVRSREMPSIIPIQTHQGENLTDNSPNATISVMNVYIADEFGKLPEGAGIKSMRIVQLLCKPEDKPNSNDPRIGYADQGNARMPLGVVPVEEDGSVYCEAPVGKPIYFQLLDENGMAVQSMRSVTYVHPGEQMSCVGCHESKWESPPVIPNPLAMQRPPSKIQPEVQDQYPFSFHRHVKPVLDNSCDPCHQNSNVEPTSMEYWDLEPYAFYLAGGGILLESVHGGSRTTPGSFGAMYSRMGQALLNQTHQDAMQNGEFSEEDFRRIVLWLDCNSDELNAYKNVDAQWRGEVVWPELDVDPDNPVGVETRVVPVSSENKNRKVMPQLKINKRDEQLIITLPDKDNYELVITDVSGKTVASILSKDSKIISVSCKSLAPGVYMIKAYAPGKKYYGKCIVGT
jgi:hypothetical protein